MKGFGVNKFGVGQFGIPSVLYPPKFLTNLEYFWRGDKSVGLSAPGIVDSWTDQIKGEVASAPLEGNRMFTTTLNGRPVIQGNGVDDYLTTGNFAAGALEQPFTIWVVATIASDNNLSRVFFSGSSLVRFLSHQYDAGVDCYRIYFGTGQNGNALPAAGTPVFHLLKTGATDKLYANGVQVISGSAGANNLDGLCIGAYPVPNSFSNSKIAEIGIWKDGSNDMPAADQAKLERYVKARYSLSW